MKLEIELVPKPCWYNNLRKVFTHGEWDKVSANVRDIRKTFGKCSICGCIPNITNKDNKYLEAHEVWEYKIIDNNNGIVILKDIIPLCAYCHKAKHYGHSQLMGWTEDVNRHLKLVNNINDIELNEYLQRVWDLYVNRSKIQNWKLDLSKLKDLGYPELYEKYKNIN